jgi:hypothetical protein
MTPGRSGLYTGTSRTTFSRLTESHEIARRYRDFWGSADPVYASILDGLQDRRLASTFVSYWKIAHTMAT